jgi:hypothetical protein
MGHHRPCIPPHCFSQFSPSLRSTVRCYWILFGFLKKEGFHQAVTEGWLRRKIGHDIIHFRHCRQRLLVSFAEQVHLSVYATTPRTKTAPSFFPVELLSLRCRHMSYLYHHQSSLIKTRWVTSRITTGYSQVAGWRYIKYTVNIIFKYRPLVFLLFLSRVDDIVVLSPPYQSEGPYIR